MKKKNNDITQISNIHVSGKGKTREEIKKEVMEQFNEQLDEMLENIKDTKIEEEKKKKPLMHVIINAEETEDREGFGVSVDIEGEYEELMTMLTMATASALEAIMENEYSELQLFSFITALIHEYNERRNKEEK